MGLERRLVSPSKWIDATGAIGIVVRSGRYGGTYAHKDIAFKFASWISVEFQRLKEEGMPCSSMTASHNRNGLKDSTKLQYNR